MACHWGDMSVKSDRDNSISYPYQRLSECQLTSNNLTPSGFQATTQFIREHDIAKLQGHDKH